MQPPRANQSLPHGKRAERRSNLRPLFERSIAKQGEHSDVFSDHLVNCFFSLALFVVACWISWCLMCFPLVLDGVWLFFWLVVDCFWWSLMVIDWCLMVFDGRLMFLLICFDGFSMVFHWFLMLRDGVWSAKPLRKGNFVGGFGWSDGIPMVPLEVIMDSPVLKHRGKVWLPQWRTTWGKTMGREPLRRIFWGQKHDKQNSQVWGVSQFQSSCWKMLEVKCEDKVRFDPLWCFIPVHIFSHDLLILS